MPNLHDITTALKADIQNIITKDFCEFPKEVNSLKGIVRRSHTYQSLDIQLRFFIDEERNKKKWFFFRAGLNKITSKVNKLIKHYSSEKRIRDLEQQIQLLNDEIKYAQEIHEHEKLAILNKFKKIISDLQVSNSKLTRQVSGLLSIKGDKHNIAKNSLSKLSALVKRVQVISEEPSATLN